MTIDEELVPVAKQHARSMGLSLSQLIEQALRDISTEAGPSFSERWRGKFKVAVRDEARFRVLAKKYL